MHHIDIDISGTCSTCYVAMSCVVTICWLPYLALWRRKKLQPCFQLPNYTTSCPWILLGRQAKRLPVFIFTSTYSWVSWAMTNCKMLYYNYEVCNFPCFCFFRLHFTSQQQLRTLHIVNKSWRYVTLQTTRLYVSVR